MKLKTFTQIDNQEKSIVTLADGYKSDIDHEHWLVDGLQKDAIQNSWDARIDRKSAKNWECGFVFKNITGNKFFYIIDEGTTGLNGTRFENYEDLVKILNSNKRGEDLAYFLNSNWSAKSSDEGGNRGRGKTLFLVASRKKRIFFDSFRATDNSYVVGEIFLDTDKQVKFTLCYDADAINKFNELTDGKIDSKTTPGTRIFIVDPEISIEKSMESGEIISFISHSRWETIKKYNARIFIEYNNERKYVNYPFWYDDEVKNVSSKEFRGLIKSKMKYKVSKLVLRYAPDVDLPETIKGIAIQRGGMTIERLSAGSLIHEEGVGNLYGWVEMESKPLEEEMLRLCENPNHFRFSWNMKPAKYLKEFIISKTREFAKELKIIDSEQAKNRIQKIAEDDALRKLTPLFKKLNFFGKHQGKNTRKNISRKDNEPLRLSIADLNFPNRNRRVNYGDRITNAYVVPINEFCDSIMVLIRVFIVLENGRTEIIEEKEINLHRGKGSKIGMDSFLISEKYTKGVYSIKAKMISLEDVDEKLPDGRIIEKGTVLYDRINQKFYIEMDPPESGPFKLEPKGRDDKNYLFEWESEDDGYLIFYNEFHPRIKKLLSDAEKLTLYLSEQLALIAFQIKLEELIAENDKDDEDFSKLIKSKDPSQALPFLFSKFSEFLWDSENK
jgi:hypothetical protein